ncbi:MAG: hypothetical protein LAT50_12115 [Ectothiorhodospiraceae bacterium]|nr:hypothetical protein [Ectothiorhodospiraceae bacterium]
MPTYTLGQLDEGAYQLGAFGEVAPPVVEPIITEAPAATEGQSYTFEVNQQAIDAGIESVTLGQETLAPTIDGLEVTVSVPASIWMYGVKALVILDAQEEAVAATTTEVLPAEGTLWVVLDGYPAAGVDEQEPKLLTDPFEQAAADGDIISVDGLDGYVGFTPNPDGSYTLDEIGGHPIGVRLHRDHGDVSDRKEILIEESDPIITGVASAFATSFANTQGEAVIDDPAEPDIREGVASAYASTLAAASGQKIGQGSAHVPGWSFANTNGRRLGYAFGIIYRPATLTNPPNN